MKKKFVYLKPKSTKAISFFEGRMLGLQSCEILNKTSEKYLLKPIMAPVTIELPISGENEDWLIESM